MDKIHHFIRSSSAASDSELISMMRNGMYALPTGERKDWLVQLELSLDGYGGPQSERASRVRTLLPQIDTADEQETSIVLEAPGAETPESL